MSKDTTNTAGIGLDLNNILAAACAEAGISDSKYESLSIAVHDALRRATPAQTDELNGGMHASIFVKVWGDAGGGDAGRIALANYAYELGRRAALAHVSPAPVAQATATPQAPAECVWCDGEGKVRPDPEDAASEDDCEHCNGTGRAAASQPSPVQPVGDERARVKRAELSPEVKAALAEAAETRSTAVILPNGSALFINYGDQPEDTADLSCTACGGSGHIEDQQARALAQPAAAATPEQPTASVPMCETCDDPAMPLGGGQYGRCAACLGFSDESAPNAPEQPATSDALQRMRAAFHINMMRAYPGKTHAEIAAEIDKAVGAAQPATSDFHAPLKAHAYIADLVRNEIQDVLQASGAAQPAKAVGAPSDEEIIDVLWDASGRGWKPDQMPKATDRADYIYQYRQLIAAFRTLLSRAAPADAPTQQAAPTDEQAQQAYEFRHLTICAQGQGFDGIASALIELDRLRKLAAPVADAVAPAEPVAYMQPNGNTISAAKLREGLNRQQFVQDLWKDATPLYAAPVGAVAQPGYKLVPLEPTVEMRNACYNEYQKDDATYDSMCRAIIAAAPEVGAVAQPFQQRVQPWMMTCFGAEISADKQERNHRFFEEATELVQACGMPKAEAYQLVDYVYGRPLGEPSQEVGGVMVTLAALCLAQGMDMHAAAETELARIWTKVEAIRAKQATKPKGSALPVAVEVGAVVGAGDARDDFARGVIAALGVLASGHGYTHGTVYHDEIVRSVGEATIYAAAEDDDYAWAGLDPSKNPDRAAMSAAPATQPQQGGTK